MKRLVYSLVLLASVFAVNAQQLLEVKNFRSDWLVYQQNLYQKFDPTKKVNTIYFWLETTKYAGSTLRISGSNQATIFINGKLATKPNTLAVRLPIDSLRNLYQTPNLLVGIYEPRGHFRNIETVVESLVAEEPLRDVIETLSFSSFRDFVIVGLLILLVMFIVVVQLNPKLASDYFSVTKIFSRREGDDSQVYSRITSSINILFYAYCSLLLGYFLILVFHFIPTHYQLASLFYSNSFADALWSWFRLSGLLLAIFFLKIMLVYGLSLLFGIKDVAGLHFFNWIRLLLLIFGGLTTVLVIYFISRGQSVQFNIFLVRLIAWILVGWMLLIFLKLSGRVGHSMFHLFLYICATEFIPFLILIKVLYN